MRLQSNRPGFAIPMAILVISLMTVALAAGLMLVSAEQRTVGDQQVQAAALGIAQQGIDAYIRHPENPAFRPGGRAVHTPPLNYDTMWVPVNPATGDTAIVIARLFHVSTSATVDTMYVLSSLGRRGVSGIKGTPKGQRAVAEIVTWSSGATVPVKAAWMSLSGVSKNGVAGTLSGKDDASPPCTAGGNVAGVTVPTTVGSSSGYTGPVGDGTSGPLYGSPPLDTTSIGSTPQAAGDSMAKSGLDWSDWSKGLNLPNVWRLSDHGGSYPSFADTTYYPIIYVSGDAVLPSGQGMLVVSGSLTIDGSIHWNGIILVGGGVTANGNDNVEGAVLSGLNIMLDSTNVPVSSVGNGNKTIDYNSCQVKKALSGTKALIPRKETWTDTWKTY